MNDKQRQSDLCALAFVCIWWVRANLWLLGRLYTSFMFTLRVLLYDFWWGFRRLLLPLLLVLFLLLLLLHLFFSSLIAHTWIEFHWRCQMKNTCCISLLGWVNGRGLTASICLHIIAISIAQLHRMIISCMRSCIGNFPFSRLCRNTAQCQSHRKSWKYSIANHLVCSFFPCELVWLMEFFFSFSFDDDGWVLVCSHSHRTWAALVQVQSESEKHVLASSNA